MNKELNEKIKVMQYFAAGGEVEFRCPSKHINWTKTIAPSWNWDTLDYRIKEEPKTRPLTFEELIPFVGTPVRIEFRDEVYYESLALYICKYKIKWVKMGNDYIKYQDFHNHVTRLDGSKFKTEVEG